MLNLVDKIFDEDLFFHSSSRRKLNSLVYKYNEFYFVGGLFYKNDCLMINWKFNSSLGVSTLIWDEIKKDFKDDYSCEKFFIDFINFKYNLNLYSASRKSVELIKSDVEILNRV